MKRLMALVFCLFSFFLITGKVTADDDLVKIAQEFGYPATAEMAPKGAIVIDADTGQILFGKDMDLQRDPASTTKTMVIYLTMEAIKAGKISMDTEVTATATDQAISGIFELSNNKIVAGVSYTVRELLTMTFVPSSNVATLMLAHLIFDGTDAQFLELMNQTAQELGMTNTIFYNGTGANIGAFKNYYAPEGYDPERYNLTTAKDLAILARTLLKKHPEVLDFTHQATVTVKAGTPYQETYHTYNHSLPGSDLPFEGVDGLKTGSSPTADYNAIVTAKQGATRLIVVVLGASKWGDPQGEYVRHYFVNSLLNDAFKNFTKKEVVSKGELTIDGKNYQVDEALTAFVRNNAELPEVKIEDGEALVSGLETVEGPLTLSIKSGQHLATSSSGQSQSSNKKSSSQSIEDKALPFLQVFVAILAVIVLVLLGLIAFLVRDLRS